MTEHSYHSLLNEATVLWVAVCGENNIPNVARVAGNAPVNDLSFVTFYLSEAFGKSVLDTVKVGQWITLLTVNMSNFESYQFKGKMLASRSCTPKEEEEQQLHLRRFTNVLLGIGIAKNETEKISRLYFQQPSYAITFCVQEIFLQTPGKGAGRLTFKMEESK